MYTDSVQEYLNSRVKPFLIKKCTCEVHNPCAIMDYQVNVLDDNFFNDKRSQGGINQYMYVLQKHCV